MFHIGIIVTNVIVDVSFFVLFLSFLGCLIYCCVVGKIQKKRIKNHMKQALEIDNKIAIKQTKS